MTPLLQLRLWWRRGSGSERLASTIAFILVLVLAAWVLVPTGSDEPGGTTAVGTVADTTGGAAGAPGGVAGGPGAPAEEGAVAGPAPGEAGAPAPGGETPAGPAGEAPAGGAPAAGAGAPATAGGDRPCLAPPAGTPGVTDKEIQIGVGVLELAGPIGNSAAGQASSDDFKKMAQAVIDDINGRGGLQCRKVVAKFYEGNPINPEQTRAACLQMIQDRPLLVADAGAFAYPAGAYNCLPQQKVPIITQGNILGSEISRFAPYLASTNSDAATAMRDVAFGARDRGLFDPAKGFKKLGLLFDDCSTEFNRHLEESLAKAGVTAAQISKYVFPCPASGFAPPTQMSQAVSQHQLAGVTHVLPLTGGGSFKPYTEIAEGQRFRPRYILTDYVGIIITSASSLKPNAENFDRAIAITTGRFGQDTTPGFQADPGTRRCQALIVKAGFPPDHVYKGGGGACNVLWATEAALKNAKALTREAALPGLFDAGNVQLSYPQVDSTYRAPAKYHGGDSWWPIEWHKECTCWRVLDANRKPSFPA